MPSPSPSCGPVVRNRGTSAPSAAARSWSAAAASGCPRLALASVSAAAASELPPPRPAPTGIRLSIVILHAGSTPAAEARAISARVTSVSAGKPSTSSSSEGSSDRVSASWIRSYTVTSSCLPSSRRGPTTSARLIFAGATRLVTRAAPKAGRTGRVRAPPRGSRGRGRARRARRQQARGAARPASSNELGSVFRRWANAPCTTSLIRPKSEGCGNRTNATSIESTRGRGRKTVRDTACEPVRRAES